jgi:hypothetical protein
MPSREGQVENDTNEVGSAAAKGLANENTNPTATQTVITLRGEQAGG